MSDVARLAHDCGAADGFLLHVMPFVDGETLRARLTRERRLPLPRLRRPDEGGGAPGQSMTRLPRASHMPVPATRASTGALTHLSNS